MLTAETQSIGDRYRLLDLVGEGGMGSVYRALDRLTGAHVALKQVALAYRESQSEGSVQLRYALVQEFKMLASLRHPNIISVLDYGFDAEPYFTLELLENALPFGDFAHGQPLARQVEWAIQLLQALAYLHQRGILHRDLKPGNVLIVDDQVKVLDFGLAIGREHFNPDEGMVGTLAYIAPEIIGYQSPSVASDLYAVGVMLYQMLVGQVPFPSGGEKYDVMLNIINTIPDMTPIQTSPIRDVIARLLRKDPADRYASANEVIAALCDATGLPRPLETSAVRESFLQAAQFVGRDAEFDTLRAALTESLAGRGGAWLIGGESGVGKSRLLDELRTHALIEGALVLRGQAIADVGLPYQIWRSALRRLILHADLNEYAAAVLKPLIPDIERLLERPVGASPDIDAQSLQLRLLSVIESLFRQQKRPVVLLLEDLHWADDSLVLLKRLNDLALTSALLIVGTYRDDEYPTLPDEFPTLQHMTLGRLSSDAIEQLSASMLGEVGKSRAVLDLLKRETEGNVFFIVEVVRALAEESGQLADIGQTPLPVRVFAGGMQTVIQRRLDKVPASAHRLLTAAAVGGRELDLAILRRLMPAINLDDWLQTITPVIDVRGSHIRFAHDKLRESLLERLDAQDRRGLHHQIAQAIEAVYPDAPDQYAALAYHWAGAGDAAKTIPNAIKAGENALRSGSYRDAIRLFEQAHALTEQSPLSRLEMIRLKHLIGASYWGQTDMGKAQAWHSQSLRLMGIAVPDAKLRLTLGTLKPLALHVWGRITRRPPRSKQPEQWLIAAQSLHQISQVSYHDANLSLGLYCLFHGMVAAERGGESPEALRLQALEYTSFGFGMGDNGLHRLAESYRRLAQDRLNRASVTEPDPETLAWSDLFYGIYLAGRGQWDECNRCLNEAMEISLATGSQRLWIDACGYQAFALYLQSRYAEAAKMMANVAQVATRDGHVQSIGRAHIARARMLLLQGKTDEARAEYFDNADAIHSSLTVADLTPHRIASNAFLVEFYSRIGAWDTALEAAAELDRLLASAQTISGVLAGASAASISLYLSVWEREQTPGMDRRVAALLTLYHRKYARMHDIGAAVEQTYRCWYHWLRGDEKAARTAGAAAIKAAQQFKMPYYEASAHYHLGRFMPASDPTRAGHVEVALTLFERVGATHEVNRIRFPD